MEREKIKNAKNFDELLDIKYGKIGSEKRDIFEEKAQYFVISEILKEARKEANMTQEQLIKIIEEQKDLKNLPNSNLIQMMDLLSLEFEDVKKNLISMTFHLDKVEELYNNSLKEFQNRA